MSTQAFLLKYGVWVLLMVAFAFLYLRVTWEKKCRTKAQLLIERADGNGYYAYADLSDGGIVSIKNPKTGAVRCWPLTALSVVGVPYPEIAPGFLRGVIRQTRVSEDDWEPQTNRSPYVTMAASPDVKAELQRIRQSCQGTDAANDLDLLINRVSPAPTRAMIASPALLGSLFHQVIAQLLMQTTKDFFQMMSDVAKNLKTVKPLHFLLGLLVVAGMLVFVIVQVRQIGPLKDDLKSAVETNAAMSNQLSSIQGALGILQSLSAPTPTPMGAPTPTHSGPLPPK